MDNQNGKDHGNVMESEITWWLIGINVLGNSVFGGVPYTPSTLPKRRTQSFSILVTAVYSGTSTVWRRSTLAVR